MAPRLANRCYVLDGSHVAFARRRRLLCADPRSPALTVIVFVEILGREGRGCGQHGQCRERQGGA